MRAADQIHVVFLKEPRDNVWTEGEGDTSVVFAPPSDVLVRIRPQEIAEQAAIGDLVESADHGRSFLRTPQHGTESRKGKCRTYIGGSHDAANLLHRVQIWAQSSMHREDLLVNDGRNRQAVEAVGERLP